MTDLICFSVYGDLIKTLLFHLACVIEVMVLYNCNCLCLIDCILCSVCFCQNKFSFRVRQTAFLCKWFLKFFFIQLNVRELWMFETESLTTGISASEKKKNLSGSWGIEEISLPIWFKYFVLDFTIFGHAVRRRCVIWARKSGLWVLVSKFGVLPDFRFHMVPIVHNLYTSSGVRS